MGRTRVGKWAISSTANARCVVRRPAGIVYYTSPMDDEPRTVPRCLECEPKQRQEANPIESGQLTCISH